MFPTVGLIVNISSIAVLWVGAGRVANGDLQVGSLVAYLSYLIQILMSVVMVTFMVSMIPRASVAADRVVEVLEAESSVRPPESPVTEVTEHGTIEFRDVSFAYPGAGHPVLDDVSFRVGPGETTAIIGSTGAGKTTIVNLVTRLFDATEGAVLVNGVDVRQLAPELLWGKVGYVPQQRLPVLRHGRLQPALRTAGRHRGRAVGGARDRAGDRLRAGDARRHRERDHPGRHERVRRPAPAAGDRPSAGRAARHLRVRRRVLGARPRHRRPPAGGAGAAHRPRPRS